MKDEDNLKKLKRKIVDTTPKPIKKYSSLDSGCDLTAGIIVGMLSGYYLDKFFHSKPLFFIICLLLGLIAGILNIYRNL